MNPSPEERPVRAASTLILLRDAADGVEVLMLKRHGLSETLGGAFVFPGGKVDAEDAARGVDEKWALAEAKAIDGPVRAILPLYETEVRGTAMLKRMADQLFA